MKTRKIITRNGQEIVIDELDYADLCAYTWRISDYGYAVRTTSRADGPQTVVSMHRQIMLAPFGFEVDHVNGDKLDNRRKNLRICLHAQNLANRKANKNNALAVKGVTMKGHRYAAQIRIDRKMVHLGMFDTAELAQQAFDKKHAEIHGEFSHSKRLEIL